MDAVSKALDYAKKRAKETGKPYLVTTEGHSAWACAFNIRAYKEIGCTIYKIVKPQK